MDMGTSYHLVVRQNN